MEIPGKVVVSANAGLTHDAGIRNKIISTETKVDTIFVDSEKKRIQR